MHSNTQQAQGCELHHLLSSTPPRGITGAILARGDSLGISKEEEE